MHVLESLENAHRSFLPLVDGDVASYIPELARADPERFAISAVLVDGRVFEVGDAQQTFTIQSNHKPFSFACALKHLGLKTVRERVGVEPTGTDFNSIAKLDRMKRPMNPMVNAGAIAVCGLLLEHFGTNAESMLAGTLNDFVGSELSVDKPTFESELETTDGNRALAYLLSKFGILKVNPLAAVELYVKMCSLQLDTRRLATMGATLANHGVNPISGNLVLGLPETRDVLSVMLTCGMYNYAGQWVFDVGLPAKSGVSGAVVMIVPGVMAIAVYSPRLDKHGTSVRGIAVCRKLSRRYGLHLLDPARPQSPEGL